ncbi:glycosyltransferase family 4 protein [Phormidesmis sp. 146-35]
MQIWHVGASPSITTVDGCNNTVWSLAREQASLGHHVTLVLDQQPDHTAQTIADHNPKLHLCYLPSNFWHYEPDALSQEFQLQTPDIVHFHSIFIHKQASLARQLRQIGIPYVITPHARVLSQRFGRSWIKKYFYNWLIEKARFRGAAAITTATVREEAEIRSFIPGYQGTIHSLLNPIDTSTLSQASWERNSQATRLVYLGRFDVLVKGIDRLIELARLLPQVEVHLYGTEDPKTKSWLARLKADLPTNVYFHPPVFGVEKIQVLKKAALYIQMSRQEMFGISIAEAMCIGTPCAIAETLNIAELFHHHNLGLVLPADLEQSAIMLSNALRSEARLNQWSERAKQFAQSHFEASAIAANCLQLYEQVLCQRDPFSQCGKVLKR